MNTWSRIVAYFRGRKPEVERERFVTETVFGKKVTFRRPAPVSIKSVSGPDFVSQSSGGRAISSSWTVEKAVRDGMKSTVWVYACVSKLANSIASAPLVAATPDGEILDDHPLNDLLRTPNKFWSGQDLVERFAYHLLLGGNGIITKNRGDRPYPAPVLELWVTNPDSIKPVPDPLEYISHYEFTASGGRRKPVPVEDVIHIQLTDPDDPFWGLSPLIAGARVVDTEVEAIEWNKTSLRNRAVADGMISFGSNLEREQWLEARYRLREQHMGSNNARVPFVFGNDAKWQSISLTPVEMDFIESRKMTREEICSLFGVPPILVGILDRATYSNFETARDAFWNDTVLPLMANISDAMSLGFRMDFGDVVVRFDLRNNDVLNRLTKEVVGVAKDLWAMGVPFEQVNDRLKLGFDSFPGWSTSYVPSSVVPASVVNIDPVALTSVEPPQLESGETSEKDRILSLATRFEMLALPSPDTDTIFEDRDELEVIDVDSLFHETA